VIGFAFEGRDYVEGCRYHAFIGRFSMAVLLLLSRLGKVVGPTATIAWIASTGLPMPTVGYALAIVIELGGGLLLILGWQTRALAAVLSVYAIATAFIFHRNIADQNQLFHFLKNLAVTGGLQVKEGKRWHQEQRPR
jgi:putative oxidoreductase